MKLTRIVPIIIVILISALAAPLSAREPSTRAVTDSMTYIREAQPETADTTQVPDPMRASAWNPPAVTERKDSPDWWLNRIKGRTFDIKDTDIIYPGFVGLCVDIYNWGDRFFNTYDPEYVVGTGTKWKATVKSSNWTDSYSMTLGKTQIQMLSNVYSSFGPYISFMAVSIGYEANLNRLISHLPTRQKRWAFSFSTSLFWLDLYYNTNKDGTVIRRFGDYRDTNGHLLISQPFSGLQLRNFGLDIYYFVNNKRYSQGAAYNFSKIQKKSQGSLLLGLTLSHQYIDLDFSTLPGALQAELPYGSIKHYNFTYNDFCLMVGYGYNLVLGKHWLWNITALPNVGIKHCMPQNVGGRRELFSFNAKGNTSFVFNSGSFFAGAFANIDLHWYNSSRVSFANAVMAFGAQAGYRF